MPTELLVSVALSGGSHEFRFDQFSDLYDMRQKGHYATESGVVFLAIAALEDKPGKRTFHTSDGVEHEVNESLAEHHDYLVVFDRDGNYQKRIQIEDTFAIHRIGVFPSGAFLALGFDKQDRSPKLALLKDDGTLLKFIEIPKGDAPESMFGTKDGSGDGPAIYIAPSQLVPFGDSIIVVQEKTKFPLLEVNQAGAVRVIKPKLPEGMQINTLIPSDENLYAHVGGLGSESIYELSEYTGAVLKRFLVSENDPGANVACLHDGKFLSFEHGDGKLVPLIGTSEPAADVPLTDPKAQTSNPPSSASH